MFPTYDPNAFTSYEQFLFSQFHINTQGLYYWNNSYLIYCPDITDSTLSTEGIPLSKWLDGYKIMGTWISLVSKIPDGAIRIDDKISDYISREAGYLITKGDVENEIALLIPKTFPDFVVNIAPGLRGINVNFTEPITAEGKNELEAIFALHKFPLRVFFSNESVPVEPPGESGFFSEGVLSTSRFLNDKLSPVLKMAWEEDEDKWLDIRNSLLNDKQISGDAFRPRSLAKNRFRCLVDCSLFTSADIRNYLSLYEEVCLVMPAKEDQERIFKSLGVTEDELVELVKLNRIHTLFPRDIKQYKADFLEQLLGVNKSHVHISRQLTALTLAEIRNRNPLYLPAVSNSDRQLLLSSIGEAVEKLPVDEKLKKQILSSVADMGYSWVRIPGFANQHDSAFLSMYGISNLIQAVPAFSSDNFKMALQASAPGVDWAAATGSTLIPVQQDTFDLSFPSSLIANLYSGVPEDWVMKKPNYANFAVEDVLSISKYIPVVELAQSFEGAEINRFRQCILSISQNQESVEELQEVTYAFNEFVKKYERRNEHWAAFDISGFVLNLAASGLANPLSKWALKGLVKYVLKNSSKAEFLGKVIDEIEGNITGHYPNAILVSRMRDKIKRRM